MDSSVSPKDKIWFLRVCHHISNADYDFCSSSVGSSQVDWSHGLRRWNEQGGMRKWCRLFEEGKTMRDSTPPLVRVLAHFSNSSRGKLSSVPHTFPNLHQVIITCFSISNFWSAADLGMTKRQKAWLKGWSAKCFDERHKKVGSSMC